MKLAELVFIAVVLLSLITVFRMAYNALRQRWGSIGRIAIRWFGFTIVYLSIVIGVSLATPRQWVAIAEEQRFDDWCVAVLRVDHHQRRYDVEIRVTNRARGRPQSARDARLVLVTTDGRTVEAIAGGAQRSLRSKLLPGEAFTTECQFDVPDDVELVGIDVIHGAWPQLFIVGDRGSLFHKRPLVRLQ